MDLLRREFVLGHFGFKGASPDQFYRFQWRWPQQPATYVAYRIGIALYQLVWNILVIVFWDDPRFYRPVDTTAKWPIYLSNWSFFFLTIYFLTAAISTVAHYMQMRRDKVSSSATEAVSFELGNPASPKSTSPGSPSATLLSQQEPTLPWYFKLTWLLQTVALNAVLFVAMGYWFFEYDPALEKLQVFTIHVHAVAAVLGIVDFFVVANPFRVLHFIYPVIYFTTYIVFTLIYYHSGGINPYGGREMYEDMIDWEDNVGVSVGMSFVFIVVLGPVLHLIYLGLYVIRRLVAGEISSSCIRCRGRGSGEGASDDDHDNFVEEGRRELVDDQENDGNKCCPTSEVNQV
ncbi:protein rolling stone-like [Diadema antillarum]|uniref:protein rolling stone-like n=1 Tax=Diadema antillarum TaxID=105358 RepID=UPI003A839F4B